MNLDEHLVDLQRRLDRVELKLGVDPTESIGNWQTPTLNSGWSNFGSGYQPVQFNRDNSGFIHVRGTVAGSGSGVVFTLPPGYWPLYTIRGLCSTAGAISCWDVSPSGTLTVTLGSGASASKVGLNICFPEAGASGIAVGFRTGSSAASYTGVAQFSPATYGFPRVMQHRNGMNFTTGMLTGGANGASTPGQIIFMLEESLFRQRVSLLHCYPNTGTTAIRVDLGGGAARYNNGGNTTTGFSLEDMMWPGPRTEGKWLPFTPQNGWVHFGAASEYQELGYYKDKSGWVFLKGVLSSGTGSAGTVLGTLPAGYRPPGHVIMRACSNDTSILVSINSTTGAVTLEQATSSWISLDGLHFHTTT